MSYEGDGRCRCAVYYEHQGILKVVDADRELDQVQETLLQVIAGAGCELKKETSEVY